LKYTRLIAAAFALSTITSVSWGQMPQQTPTLQQAVDAIAANAASSISQLRGQIMTDQDALTQARQEAATLCSILHEKQPGVGTPGCRPMPVPPPSVTPSTPPAEATPPARKD
jgi:hypothetical protein